MRDWPPCPPIQRGGGRRSRPGVTPFISALTVARCPATFPGVWPQLRDTLSTSRSVGRGTGAFIYLPPFSENSPIFCSFPFAKIQPVFLPGQPGRMKNRTPFPPSATPAGITHYTLQAKSCAKEGPPFGNPRQQNRRYAALSGSIPPFVVSSPFHGLFSPFVKFGVSQTMGYLKGKSSMMIFDWYANLKYKYGNRHFWARGHFVDTAGRNKKAIKAYIEPVGGQNV